MLFCLLARASKMAAPTTRALYRSATADTLVRSVTGELFPISRAVLAGSRPGLFLLLLWGAGSGACGRSHFDDLDRASDGSISDGAEASDGPGLTPHYVQSFVGTGQGNASTFSVTPMAIGDAVVVQAYCGSSGNPTDVALDAPGWTFQRVSPIVGAGQTKDFAASFVAIVPTKQTTVVTATWAVAACDLGLGSVGDEFADTADQLLDLVVDSAEAYGVGDCTTAVASAPGDLVWGACTGNVVATGAGFAKGADDGGGDWTEHQVVGGGSAATPVTFANGTGRDFVITAITLRHR